MQRSSTKWRSAHRAAAAVLFVAVTMTSAVAHAAPAILLLPFKGPNGRQASTRLGEALHGVRLLPVAPYLKAARKSGPAEAARAMGAVAVINGTILTLHGQWALRVGIIDVESGKLIDRRAFPLRGPRLDRATLRQVASGVAAILRRAGINARSRAGSPPATTRQPARHAPPPNTEPPPPEESADDEQPVPVAPWGGPHVTSSPTAEDRHSSGEQPTDPSADRSQGPTRDGNVGFDPNELLRRDDVIAEARGERKRDPSPGIVPHHQREPSARRSGHHREIRPLFVVAANFLLFSRRFTFIKPVPPYANFAGPGTLPALGLDAVVYPLATLKRRWLAGFGIEGRYWRSLGVQAEVQPGIKEFARAVLENFEIGTRYRWNLFNTRVSPSLLGVIDFGQQRFSMDRSGTTQVLVPDVTFSYFKLGIGAEWPYLAEGRFLAAATAQFDLMPVLSAGPIEQANSDGYGNANAFGLAGSLGTFATYRGFLARVDLFYRHFQMAFDRTCGSLGTGCSTAQGAKDVYLGATISAGYVY